MLSSCLSVEVVSTLLKRFCSLCSRLLEFVIVLVRSKLSISLYVVESVSCLVYSFVNHVVGTRAQMYLVELVVQFPREHVLLVNSSDPDVVEISRTREWQFQISTQPNQSSEQITPTAARNV